VSRLRYSVLLITTVPVGATACGLCVTAALDSFFPPITLWCLLTLSWFLAHGIVSSITGIPLGQPPILGSVLIAFFAVALGAALLGPLVVLPLALPPLVHFVRSALRHDPPRQVVVAIGAFHIVAAGLLGLYASHITHIRTDGEYIVAWSGTAPGRGKLRALQGSEPASLPDYRYVVAHGTGSSVGEAAQRIAAISTYTADGDLLETAAKRLASDPGVTAMLQEAVARLKAKRQGA